MNIIVRENSLIAKIAARKLRTKRVAIVVGRTIHLYNVSTQMFLQDQRWVKHELCHIRQFQQVGFVRFILKYLWESVRRGYYLNKYEVEARGAEREEVSRDLLADLIRNNSPDNTTS